MLTATVSMGGMLIVVFRFRLSVELALALRGGKRGKTVGRTAQHFAVRIQAVIVRDCSARSLLTSVLPASPLQLRVYVYL